MSKLRPKLKLISRKLVAIWNAEIYFDLIFNAFQIATTFRLIGLIFGRNLEATKKNIFSVKKANSI